jgi:P pilus assembly chaperone PapD
MKTLAALAILAMTVAPAQAQTSSLTGKWNGTMTRTAPDGRTQSIDLMLDLTQKAKVLTGTVGPNAERQWPIEKGVVNGTKVTFQVQQPDGPLRTFTLTLVDGRLVGDMLAEMNGQSFTAKVDAGRSK